jgi:hypothetical protein
MVAPEIVQSYLHSPASRPPDGTVANLEHPAKHNNGPLCLLVVCIVLTVVAASARIYSRLFVVMNLRLEEYMLLAFASIDINMHLLTGYTAIDLGLLSPVNFRLLHETIMSMS